MFRRGEIDELVKLFEARQVILHHACQLTDFRSYLELGGIPSRSFLQANTLAYTNFETDSSDRQNDVWDKVFINLSDFGWTFSAGYGAVPNPYGPILFQIRPIALYEAQDVAICLRSAGAVHFNRERESLKSIEEVDRLFKHPLEDSSQWKAIIKSGNERKEAFPRVRDPRDPEISCTVLTGSLSIRYVTCVIADPYVVKGRQLEDVVIQAARSAGVSFSVRRRVCQDKGREGLYRELGSHLARGPLSLENLVQSSATSKELKAWASVLVERQLGWQFERYTKYLREGTLLAAG